MLELMAGAAILVGLLAVSLQFFHATALHRRTTRQREVAIEELANVMERLAAIRWQDLTTEKARQVQLSDVASRSLPGAALTIEVSQPAADKPLAKRIAVALAWEDQSRRLGRPMRLSAWRYRNEGGP
jgi:hypothetical protein